MRSAYFPLRSVAALEINIRKKNFPVYNCV